MAARTPYELVRLKLRTFSWLIMGFALLAIAGCGGEDSAGETPGPALSATSLSGQATGTPSTPGALAVPETGSGGDPVQSPTVSAIAGGTAEGSPQSEIAHQPNEGTDEHPSMPEGVTIGTPRSDDPVLRENPPIDVTVEIPTPRSSSFDSDGDGLLTHLELIEAIRASYASYDWPVDYQLDLDIIVIGIEEEAERFPVFYENGSERTMLMISSLCAWQYALRDALFSDDQNLILQSVDHLRTTLGAHPEQASLQEIVGDAVDRAELGDPAPLQAQIDGLGCAAIPWESGTDDSAMSGTIVNGLSMTSMLEAHRDAIRA